MAVSCNCPTEALKSQGPLKSLLCPHRIITFVCQWQHCSTTTTTNTTTITTTAATTTTINNNINRLYLSCTLQNKVTKCFGLVEKHFKTVIK